MKNNSSGQILVVFVVLIAMAALLYSFIMLQATRLTESGSKTSESKAFYVAEAGLNKAIWYLQTPSSEGGQGTSWRTSGFSQSFGDGIYTFSIADTATQGEILIVSTGEVYGLKKAISQLLSTVSIPSAFNYSVFGNSNVTIGTTYNIFGDMFVNGNTKFSGSGTAVNVYHTAGKTVTGGGVDAGVPSDVPTFPVLDTTYYSNEINQAKTVAAGNVTISNTTVNLGGGTMYVNGSATFSTVTFMGPGKIVASGNVLFSAGPNSCNNEKITVISGAVFSTTGNNTRLNNMTYYGQTSASLSNSFSGTGINVLSSGNISLSGNVAVSGMLYSKAGSVSLGGSSNVTGSIVAATGVTATKADIQITHDNSAFSGNMPAGFPSEKVTPKKGGWKEF